jgi:methylisocitrate lyase
VRAGFPAAYVSGYATALQSGVPDIGLITREDVCRRIRELHAATGVPVVSDADTGFGEPEAVYVTVHEYARAGAAGCHIEDQVFPKRCGHLVGKQVVQVTDFVQKIKAAVDARASSVDPDFVLIARSDAKAVEGFDAMKARCRAYAEAGADCIFPEATSTIDEFAELVDSVKDVRTPSGRAPWFIANMTEFGTTQRITLQDFQRVGYHGVIFPVSMMRVQQYAARRLAEAIIRDGHTGNGPPMMTQAEELALSRYKPGAEWHFPTPGFEDVPAETEMPGAWSEWFQGSTAQNVHQRR